MECGAEAACLLLAFLFVAVLRFTLNSPSSLLKHAYTQNEVTFVVLLCGVSIAPSGFFQIFLLCFVECVFLLIFIVISCYLIVSWVLSFLCKWSVSLSLLGFALQDLPSIIQPKGRQVNRASISLSTLYWLALFHTAFVLEIEWTS